MANFKKASVWINNDGSMRLSDISSLDARVALSGKNSFVTECRLTQEIALEDGDYLFPKVAISKAEMLELLDLDIDEDRIECDILVYRDQAILSVRFK